MSTGAGNATPQISESDCTVAVIPLESLFDIWERTHHPLTWPCLFVLPPWLRAWWQVFGEGLESEIVAVRLGERIIGIAPLVIEGRSARLMGHGDVCDYQDVVVDPGHASLFFPILLKHLSARGIRELDLESLRPDSVVVAKGLPVARKMGFRIICEQTDVTMELPLPDSWEEYLQRLDGKQRHEIRRKLRRLKEAAPVSHRVVTEAGRLEAAMDVFMDLFQSNRAAKAAFMTDRTQAFFRKLARAMADSRLLRLGFLDLGTNPAAAVMCFDYRKTVYLYNNGYDRRYHHLSVGGLSKVLMIKDCIERGRKMFDFLKGAESYKRHLGGREIPLLHCRIRLQASLGA